MNLMDIIQRTIPPVPWQEGEKIPWHDPDFSERMLREHLSQEHDAASRRLEIIDQHVGWIHTQVLGRTPSRVLDLGCGPGLYTSQLADLGHTCVGVDFSPASIRYARSQAEESGLDCSYIQADVRQADFGDGYSLVMMVYGELNVFRPVEGRKLLEKARQALKPGGKLLLEVHTLPAVRDLGEAGTSWRGREEGLFSDQPHLYLHEAYWDAELKVATERYYIIDARSGAVTRHAASTQGYTEEGYTRLLTGSGFVDIQEFASLNGENGPVDEDFVVYVARKLGGD